MRSFQCVCFKLNSLEPKLLRSHTERTVLASDIELDGTVEVLTPNQHIATVNQGEICRRIDREWVTDTCRQKKIRQRTCLLGQFPSIQCSSDSRVNYNVTNARVGQRTDYDKLVLDVWTDGSVAPADAVPTARRS